MRENLPMAAHSQTMHASSSTTTLGGRKRRRRRLLEVPDGPGGPGRVVERWMLLWRWETWASDSALERRPRGGWALTYRQALIASQDALDDYELELVDVAA
jgi:hypothetical protein